MTARYTTGFTVALHDTDAAGVLFFAHLFRRAHDAYEAFMAEIGWPLPGLIPDRALALPLVHAEADYLRPMHHGDQIQVEVQVQRVGRASFGIGYRLFDANGELAATAATVHACIRPADGAGVPLPQALVEALGGVA
jgi:1,4-dihydroxy-2-naphthoyl-CoA hydrolase